MLTPGVTVADLAAQTDLLLRTVARLDDLSAPSLCPGWTRAHVLTHLARNADGIGKLVRAAQGEDLTMYLSEADRDADIESGAGRASAEIVADCAATATRVLDELATLTPAMAQVELQRTPGGQRFPAAALPFLRLREVAYHHIDLDAGFGFTDLPEHLQQAFLDDELRRQPNAPQVRGSRAGVLAWLARGIPDGLEM